MFNFIIFILGAVLMFYMALRSRAQRHKLCTKGQKVSARVAGLAQSRHGAAYVLEFETAGGSHKLHYPKTPKGKGFSGRAIISSVAGELLDSLIFMPIVFWGADVKSLAMMLAAQVTFKVCYEIVILPVTIQVVKALKRIEGIDTFDENISYNPFRLSDI